MAPEPAKNRPNEFEISDANSDIDAVLTAIEARLEGLHGIGRIDRESAEAEALRCSEIEALDRASDEVMRGSISLESVQWIRAALEDAIGATAAAEWLPEAGPYNPPRSFSTVLFELERAAEKQVLQRAVVPSNPELTAVRDVFDYRIAGVVIRSFDAALDRLPEEDRAELHRFLQQKGMRLAAIERDLDLDALHASDNRFGGGASSADVDRPIAEIVRGLLDRGVAEMYHATGLFTYEGLQGLWVLDTHRIGRSSGQFGGFFMVDRLTWDDGHRGLANYLQDDRFHDMCVRGGVTLSDRAHAIGDRGVLLKVDLRGYLEFLQAETAAGLHRAGSPDGIVMRATCPPPAEFIRPIAVFEYP